MAERHDDKLHVWTDRAALARWGFGVAAMIFLAGGVYVALDFRVKAAEEKGIKNEAQIEVLKEKINKIDVQQQVIITNQDNDRRNQAEFRAQTESALDRILQKLDRAERRDTREPR